jgi:hypothetical protein
VSTPNGSHYNVQASEHDAITSGIPNATLTPVC